MCLKFLDLHTFKVSCCITTGYHPLQQNRLMIFLHRNNVKIWQYTTFGFLIHSKNSRGNNIEFRIQKRKLIMYVPNFTKGFHKSNGFQHLACGSSEYKNALMSQDYSLNIIERFFLNKLVFIYI